MNDFSFGRKIKFDTSGNPIINANILPSTTLSYDLGSPDKRWRDIYLSGNTIDLDGALIQKEVGGGIKIADASGNTLDGKFNNIDISGNAIINGIINQAVQLDVSGSILPTRNLVYDLGSPDKRWRDIYLSGNTIDLSGTLLSRHTDGSLMVHDSNSNMVNLRANNIIADGNLTVSGTTTTINSTTVTVQDPIITLGSDITNTKDKGIEFKYNTNKIGFFGYDDSTGNLTFLKDASNNSEVFTGTQGTIEGLAFKSTVASGTAPLTVVSSTLVTNLNADLLEGLNPSQFMRTDTNTSTTGTITSSSTITGTNIFSTGNLGIGTLNPQGKLDVYDGTLRVTSSTNSTTASFQTTNGTFLSIEAFNLDNTIKRPICLNAYGGNVGIGITNPTAMLHVNGQIKSNGNVLNSAYTFTRSGFGNGNWVTIFSVVDNVSSGIYIMSWIFSDGNSGFYEYYFCSAPFSYNRRETNGNNGYGISINGNGHARNGAYAEFQFLETFGGGTSSGAFQVRAVSVTSTLNNVQFNLIKIA